MSMPPCRRLKQEHMKTLVTNAEIEEVGESLIAGYIGKRKPPPKCIDIEGFITEFLHLPIVYASIAEYDRDKVGFLSDGKYPLRIVERGKAKTRIYPQGTIVIDRLLLQADKSGYRRFTLAHEAAHVIFERMSPLAPGPCFNRVFDAEQVYSLTELQEHLNLCESQTDAMASVLLMPRFLVQQTLNEFMDGKPVTIYGSSVMRSQDKVAVQMMADSMGVSFSALITRFRKLKLLDFRPMSEYIASEMNFGGVS